VGLQSLGVTNAVNANVTVPSFPPGTYNPVTVTFTRTNLSQPMDFTIRAYARRQAIDIRARCGASAVAGNGIIAMPDLSFWLGADNITGMGRLFAVLPTF